MTLDYPHIPKSFDTITHICADRERGDERCVVATEQGDLGDVAVFRLVRDRGSERRRCEGRRLIRLRYLPLRVPPVNSAGR
jgi:hypothetical protein